MSDQLDELTESLDIAIIGMAGRFPGARNIAAFWQNLCDGVESITHFSRAELLAAGTPPALLDLPYFVPAGTELDDIELFDGPFFGYTPRESETIDPQQRFFLECTWEALEHAGYDPARYEKLIGVFGGVSLNTYLFANVFGRHSSGVASDYFQVMMGSDKDFLTTRASYKLGLKGPSVTVQSACSTSLVAVHLACQSLLSYQSDMALAGGASISVPQKQGYLYQEGGVFSPDGHCRTFDAQAGGTVKGNGVGIVVLKRLGDALADGDTIHAVIKGSAINNDGALKIGYTAPSQTGQAEVLDAAYTIADVAPQTVGYIETHGTATPLGDPIEVAALTQMFRAHTSQKQFCALGSVKTNIGHMDAAAGVTGLIKAALALEHGLIPPTLNFQQPNPAIDFANSPFYVNSKLQTWSQQSWPRRAGVSAFGIGGTNAHVVLEEAPPREDVAEAAPWQVLTLSAKTSTALEDMTLRLADHLAQHPEQSCADVAYTTQVGRQAFRHRRIVVCADNLDAEEMLRTQNARQVFSSEAAQTQRPVIFMFPGGGAQYHSMGKDLYQTEATFRAEVDRCAALLRPHLHGTRSCDVRELLYTDNPDAPALERTSEALPALFVTEYALARLWMSWGIEPDAMIGHSLGEYVAACLAGVLSLEDALALVALRGRLFERLPLGAMLSVALPEAETRALLTARLSIAAVNGPGQCVIAGLAADIAELETQLSLRDIKCRRLPINVAAHAALVEPILPDFERFMRTVPLHQPTRRYISNMTGTWADPAEVTKPGYWVRHLRQTVRFNSGIETLLQRRSAVFLEVGPGQTLSTLTRLQHGYTADHLVLPSLRHPQHQHNDRAFVLTTLGRLWVAGVDIDWAALHAGQGRRRVPLPTYPFERRRYWIERDEQPSQPDTAAHSLCSVPTWQQAPLPITSRASQSRWLVFTDGHAFGNNVIVQLGRQARQIVRVDVGRAFAQLTSEHYTLNPDDPASYASLLVTLAEHGEPVTNVLFLWALTDQPAPALALSRLAEALHTRTDSGPVDLTVVVRAISPITGDEHLHLEHIDVAALGMIVPHLYPTVQCRVVDVDAARLDQAQPELVQAVVAEARAATKVAAAAYRGRRRWVPTSTPLPAPEADAETAALVADGSYVIVDGANGMGLAVASALAQRVPSRLLIVEPAVFPTADAWADWLATHAENDQISRKIRALQALVAQGTALLVIDIDQTDQQQLQAALKRAAQIGPLHGVVRADLGDMIAALPADRDPTLTTQALGTMLTTFEQALQQTPAAWCIWLTPATPQDQSIVRDTVAQRLIHAFVQRHNQCSSDRWICFDWDGWSVDGADWDGPLTADTHSAAVFATLWHSMSYPLDVCQIKAAPRRATIAQPPQSPSTAPANNAAGAAGTHYDRPTIQTPYLAPRTATEHALAAVWTAVLGIDRVGVHDNFFELRGDSLLALQLVGMIREQLAIDLPMRSIFETPTIAELATTINTLRDSTVEPVASSALVRLQAQGDKLPFFCVHPAGGTAVCYAELARRLAPDQPLYALQALGVDGNHAPRTSIVEMAHAYINDIRTIQPEGPYLLGGWSMGGSIAFEMARQLELDGQQVDLVVLIDTPASPSGTPPSAISDVELAASMLGPDMQLDHSTLQGHDVDTQLAIVLKHAQAVGVLPPFSPAQFQRVIHTFRTHAEAWWTYQPQHYAGKVIVLKAAESLDSTDDLLLGWQALAADIEGYVVPGTHQTMVQPPHVAALAARLHLCLEAAQQPSLPV